MAIALRIALATVLLLGFASHCLAIEPHYKEPEEYLRRTIPVIVQHWDIRELYKYAGQPLLEELNGNKK